MDAAQWSEGLGVVKSMEEKKTIRPQKPQALNCPRCNSAHTKFCYYNNYSLSQPRYFCKTCRRYWTDGGSLRNVPVGGGSRRNKRSSSSSSSSSSLPAASSIPKNQHHQMMMAPQAATLITQNPNNKTTLIQGQGQSQVQSQDLNLGYTNISLQFGNLPPYNNHPNTTTTTTSSSQFSAMQLLKSGNFGDSRHHVMMSSLPNTMIMNSPAGLNFSLDGFDQNGGMGYHQHHHHLQGGGGGVATNHQSTNMSSTITTTDGTSANARILFPFQDLKPISTSNSELLEATRGQGESSTVYWGTGELGGGSW